MDHVEQLARRLMLEFGLAADVWDFRWSRSCRKFGQCVYPWIRLGTGLVKGRIELSKPFCEVNAAEDIEDTIRHEIAHALAGPHTAHGPEWLKACKLTGCRPEACGFGKTIVPGRWQATCPHCHARHHRFKKPDEKMDYSCHTCGPKLGRVTWQLRANLLSKV